MKMHVKAGRIGESSEDAIILLLFKDEPFHSLVRHVDDKVKGAISSLIKAKEFTGKPGQAYLLSLSLEKAGSKKIILCGLGPRAQFSLDRIRGAASKGACFARNLGLKNFSMLHLPDAPCTPEDSASAQVEGIALGLYQFNKYHTEDAQEQKAIEEFFLYTDINKLKSIEKAASNALTICEATNLTRNLNNEPGNVATPTFMARAAQEAASKYGFKCKVLGQKEIEALKMHSFLSVAKGSVQEPKLVILEYNTNAKDTIVIVGKGITFDSGGISIKPSKDMEKMKWDKSGGCAIIGTFAAAASLKLPIHLVGIAPFTENLPSGSATRPGDVVVASNGKTIEIANTDAEGRLVLADALVYAAKYKPKAVIDLATLTGACVVALGDVAAGLFGNDEKLIEKVRKAGEKSGERAWPLPLWRDYDDKIKSDIADVKNISTTPGDAGAITAAAFLKKFVSYPWAHLDIAGTAWNDYDKPYGGKGATGYGVRLLIELLKDWKN
ncbi:MAG: leucyl aminopeptidase [Candidatus Micrarchaeota archaeon]